MTTAAGAHVKFALVPLERYRALLQQQTENKPSLHTVSPDVSTRMSPTVERNQFNSPGGAALESSNSSGSSSSSDTAVEDNQTGAGGNNGERVEEERRSSKDGLLRPPGIPSGGWVKWRW
jgi:hypothetical protein